MDLGISELSLADIDVSTGFVKIYASFKLKDVYTPLVVGHIFKELQAAHPLLKTEKLQPVSDYTRKLLEVQEANFQEVLRELRDLAEEIFRDNVLLANKKDELIEKIVHIDTK